MKIFIGLVEIAGYYSKLREGFRQIQIECTFVERAYNPFNFNSEKNFFSNAFQYIEKKQRNVRKFKIFFKVLFEILYFLLNISLFIWALSKFDIFIFGFNSSFFNYRGLYYKDLPILKFFQKKIIYVFNGSDSRPPYLGGAYLKNENRSPAKFIKIAKGKKKAIRKIEKYADIIINHPPTALFLEKPFILWLAIGIPCGPNSFENKKTLTQNSDRVRILHCPSAPIIKGTNVIREAIKNLKSKGYSIDYVEIIGQSNEVVLRELYKCDFVVDQVYSDTPLAGFATEAAFYGKPAVVGGYYQNIKNDISEKFIPPSCYCLPEKIEEEIKKLIVDVDYRINMGKKVKEFVENNWQAKIVAQRFSQLIKNDIPDNFYCYPQKIRYFRGGGISESKLRCLLKEIIKIGGKKALQLQDKPELEKLITDFANAPLHIDTFENADSAQFKT